ncbi:DUF1571 domain-containing protein [Urbifossiella limnaea]|uniref:DUF1571 domain-containing protein n=1 Tax=Urbifossiella limnaea TaxID=2528023 RepID=A0A517XVF6_9BACT|nr:DUF1571 domain-containing protein [Urbifossiella limnaea]QDU21493.1 hypothetical protein ETAA1_34600 [Urbifossiella limnaea]
MVRRVAVALLIAATLCLAGLGAYSKWFASPTVVIVDEPQFVKPAEPPPTEAEQFANLAQTDVVATLAACLSNYEKETTGFRATLAKRERVAGKLQEPELVRVVAAGDVPGPDKKTHIRVRMIWDQGGSKDLLGNVVRGCLYSEDKSPEQMVIFRPTALLKEFSVPSKSGLARDASRYCVKDAGMYRSMLRTYVAWKKRQDTGELAVTYLGKQIVLQAGGRECYAIKRTCKTVEADPFALDEQPPTDARIIDRDGFSEVTLFIDAERRLQVGTVIRRADGELVGEYYFRDAELVSAEFPADTFTPAALRN